MDDKTLPRKWMLAVALAQGLLLFALYKSVDLKIWPSDTPLWSFPLWTLSVVLPLLFLLSAEEGNVRRVVKTVGAFGALLALLAIYTGWQATPHDAFPIVDITVVFALTIAIACFKALMYLQQRAAQLPMSYQVLFTYSWRNFLVMALAFVFILAFWGILWLWAGLFIVIKIDFFGELFKKDWFIFPVLGLANGLGIIIFRELTKVIDSITRLLQGLIKLLLPLVVAVAVIFLGALPFTGLEVLWATGSGTALLLWLTALILFFANAVYQDGRGEAPYPLLVHRLIYGGLLVLPFLCALSFYGLWLRLEQHGWTVYRCWGFVVWAILALFAAGYVGGIIRRRAQWPGALAQVNTYMGWVVLALLLAANSPLLDFRKLSLRDQLARVEENLVKLQDFDFFYVHQNLGRPGYLALQRIKADIGDTDPQLLAKIENPQPIDDALSKANIEKFWENALYRPDEFAVPENLRPVIERSFAYDDVKGAVIFQVDLNSDGQAEYVAVPTRAGFYSSHYYSLENGVWEEGYLSSECAQSDGDACGDDSKERDILRNGAIEIVAPKYKNLKVGDIMLKPN